MRMFVNYTVYKELDEAIKIATSLLEANSRMMLGLLDKNDFKFNSGKGVEVYRRLVKCDKVAAVYTYRPKNPFTKAVAYREGDNIFFNVYKVKKLNVLDFASTLLHERAHMAGFNHGTGYFQNWVTDEKLLYSVPFYLSENIGKWL